MFRNDTVRGGKTSVWTSAMALRFVLSAACSIPLSSFLALRALANAPAMPVGLPLHTFNPTHVAAVSHVSTIELNNGNLSFGQKVVDLRSSSSHPVNSLFHSLIHSTNAQHQAAAVNPGPNLNLSSAQVTFLAGSLGGFQSLTIDVGGRSEAVSLNTRLTAAEAVAVEQKLQTGIQSIDLSSRGTASSGSIKLTGNLLDALSNGSDKLGSLTITKNVNLVDSLGTLDVTGRVLNYGTIQTAAASANMTDAINAGNIVNASGGVIQSYSGSSGSLFGADVALNALTSIQNAGTFTSANNLSLSAPVIANNGLASATRGSVNLASPSSLYATGNGTFQAANGNVNIASNNADISVGTVSLLSQQVNFNAGTGNIYTALGQGKRHRQHRRQRRARQRQYGQS